jgi:hypothetical protein
LVNALSVVVLAEFRAALSWLRSNVSARLTAGSFRRGFVQNAVFLVLPAWQASRPAFSQVLREREWIQQQQTDKLQNGSGGGTVGGALSFPAEDAAKAAQEV